MARNAHALAAAAIMVSAYGVHAAALGPDEIKQLGGDKLTAFGAEKAGNKEGTIPAYSGKALKAPASYDPKNPGQRPDPYGDKPLFEINAKNADKYADKLDGMIELFKRYPDFRMVVYPSHRDIEYPKYVLDNTLKNATSCKAVDKELRLEGCYGGFPFPIPKTGNEAMWNHLLTFQGVAWGGQSQSWVVEPTGKAVLQSRSAAVQQSEFFDPGNTKPVAKDAIYWKIRQDDIEPARKVGNKLVVLDSLDMIGVGRRVYQYIPGQRRVKLAPNLAYDTPSPNTGGGSTMDDAKGFMGALDRYDFKLVGKKEKYIMYNNFALTHHATCSDDKVVNNKGFPHPDCVRWELHRVWVVEATLKSGFRHIYAKRVMYWDEDMPQAGSVELYDAAGKLYRVNNNMGFPYWDTELGANFDCSLTLDLSTGAWAAQGLLSSPGAGWGIIARKDDRFYSPEALAGDSVR